MRDVALEQSLGESSRRLEYLLIADDSTPSQQAIANERSLRLAVVLELLPVDYREVITLRHIENLSHDESGASTSHLPRSGTSNAARRREGRSWK